MKEKIEKGKILVRLVTPGMEMPATAVVSEKMTLQEALQSVMDSHADNKTLEALRRETEEVKYNFIVSRKGALSPKTPRSHLDSLAVPEQIRKPDGSIETLRTVNATIQAYARVG